MDEYTQAQLNRLRSSGKPDPSLDDARVVESGIVVRGKDIARQVLISLLLVGRFRFAVKGVVGVKVALQNRKTTYSCTGYSNSLTECSARLRLGGIPVHGEPNLKRQWRKRSEALDIYYRPQYFHTDRFASALNSFWAAVCSPYPDSAFIALTTRYNRILWMRA